MPMPGPLMRRVVAALTRCVQRSPRSPQAPCVFTNLNEPAAATAGIMPYTDCMATNDEVPYHYEEVLAKPVKHTVPGRVEGEESMGRAPRPFIVFGALFMFVCLGVMALAIYSTHRSNDRNSKHNLEQKQLSDVSAGLAEALANPKFKKFQRQHPDAAGEEFWTLAVREQLFEDRMLGKLTSLNSTDVKPEHDFIEGVEPKHPWCSFTAPRTSDLQELVKRKADDRVVLVTFNARNWTSYGNKGVVVLWSDLEVTEFISAEAAEERFGITAEEWADPAGKLFGKKAPFQCTYE